MRKRVRFFAVFTAIMVGFFVAVGMCFGVLYSPAPAAAFDEGKMRVVVDAGHGGVDGGVCGKRTGVKESDLNLSIAFFLQDVLTDMGFEVVMTRKTQSGLYDVATKGFKKRDMQQRKEIIKSASPDLVLSVHQNFYSAVGVRGGQVFYSKKTGGEGLADGIQKRLNELYQKVGVKNRQSKQGEYFILDCADCPSVIVECGFLSNPQDEALLQKESWQKQLAEGIAGGVLEHFSSNAA